MISSIILATDGSEHARNALKVGVDLAAKYEAKLILIHVLTHDHPSAEMERMLRIEGLTDSPAVQNSEQNGISMKLGRVLRGGDKVAQDAQVIIALGEKILKTATKEAKEAGVKDVTSEIHSGDYANCIVEVANAANADMIVMGRRGLSNLKGFVTGSVSHKVSQRASCSVLTVK